MTGAGPLKRERPGCKGAAKDLLTGEAHQASGIVDYDCLQCHECTAFSYPS